MANGVILEPAFGNILNIELVSSIPVRYYNESKSMIVSFNNYTVSAILIHPDFLRNAEPRPNESISFKIDTSKYYLSNSGNLPPFILMLHSHQTCSKFI